MQSFVGGNLEFSDPFFTLSLYFEGFMSAVMPFVSYSEQRNSVAVSKSSSEISDDAALFPSSDKPLNLSMLSLNEANTAFVPHPKGARLESQPSSDWKAGKTLQAAFV